MKILADTTLPNLERLFPKPFELTCYTKEQDIPKLIQNQTILLCRSTLKVNAALLENTSIQYVATASSGTDHIDSDYLNAKKIKLIDAKGSNARSVADYVLSTIAYLKLPKLRAAVVGVGEVGSRVAACLKSMGMDIVCYDPLRALCDKTFSSCQVEALTECDLICIHVNLHSDLSYPSYHLFNEKLLTSLKPNVILINASRGGVVDEDVLLKIKQPLIYCTDVYQNEPDINPAIINYATLCTPHIGGHSIEAKQAAVVQISNALHDLYGLTRPQFNLPKPQQSLSLSNDMTWQERALIFYNPVIETQHLKAAADKKQAFLTYRKAHQFRHDFNW